MSCKNHESCSKTSCICNVPIFENLTDEEISSLDEVLVTKTFKKGQFIFREGERSDTLYVLNQGIIKISKTSDSGKEQIIRFLFPGDFFGQFALLQEKNHYANAEVLDNAIICLIHKNDFKNIIEKNPSMTYRFLLAISEKLHQADEWMGAISLLEVERRLAKILLLFQQRNKSEGNVVELPVAKKELAAWIGTTPETLSRKLSYFESLDIIALDSRKDIRILDPSGLNDIAESAI